MATHQPEPIHFSEEGAGDPAWNMAVDDALLEAKNRGTLAGSWIRLFAWSPPAVSLGRLQDLADELDGEALAAARVPVVRRSTGGKAVYHAAELTYSVVGSLTDPTWGDSLHATYRAVTDLVASGLADLGIVARLAPARSRGRDDPGSALRAACFSVAFGHELTVDGRKICGSAQRRLVHAFLQHGSLLLGPEHARLAEWVRTDRDRRALRRRLLADATDVQTQLGRQVRFDDVSAVVRRSLERRFGGRLVPGQLPRSIAETAARRLPAVRVTTAAHSGSV